MISEFEVDVTIKGKAVAVTVTVYAGPAEYVDPAGDFDFGDEKENAEYLARFESGELVMTKIQVVADVFDLIGSAYLGACHMRSGEFTKDVMGMVKEHGMAELAVGELVTEVELRAKQLKEFV